MVVVPNDHQSLIVKHLNELLGGEGKPKKMMKYLPKEMLYWGNIRLKGMGDAMGISRAEGEIEEDRRDTSHIRVSSLRNYLSPA
jgi:hypothetical protein